MTSYRDAQAHYLSPRRRDPVKRLLEEPVSREVLARAVDALDPGARRLRVLDLGSGVGDGLRLLTEAEEGERPVAAPERVHYTGMDVDPDMIATAKSLHPQADFVQADMLDPLPDKDVDLYYSCGAPYSHLEPGQVVTVLSRIFARIRAARHRGVVVVDGLGRYSMEWQPQWQRDRWDYAMTFFEDTDQPVRNRMSFFSRDSLDALICQAAELAAVAPSTVSYTDRSMLLGRHTATRTFHREIPAWRSLVNELFSGAESVPMRRLWFHPPSSGAPEEVLACFARLATRWNAALEKAISDFGSELPGSSTAAVALGRELLTCERELEQGLGAGHSIMATVVVDAC